MLFSSLNEYVPAENQKLAAKKKKKDIWGNGSCYRKVLCYYFFLAIRERGPHEAR